MVQIVEPRAWRVLLVEDEFDSVQMMSKILKHYGAEVFIARNGIECLKMLSTLKPTFVIMDLALPEMDGWETLHAMRLNPETADIPVAAITAYHSVSVEEDAARAGFNAYYSKPLDITSIIKQLSKLVES